MSKIFKPRRGTKATMTTTKSNTVLAAGEMFVEFDGTVGQSNVALKFGDGTSAYSSLPYALKNTDVSSAAVTITADASTSSTAALNNVTNNKSVGELVGSLKQAITKVSSELTASIDDLGNSTNSVLQFPIVKSGTSYGYKTSKTGEFVAFRGDSTDTYTYASGSTGGTVDLGARNNYRYVNASNVYNKGKSDGVTTHTGTYTFPSNDTGGTKDLGVNHYYRYVNATNVYNKGYSDGKGNVKMNIAQGYGMVYNHFDMVVAANNSSMLIGGGVGTYDLCDDFSCTITTGTWAIYTFTIKKAKTYLIYGAAYNGVNYTTHTLINLPANAVVRMLDPSLFSNYQLRFIACIADY